jgi:hypothetical protein
MDGLVAVSGDTSENILLAPPGTRGDGNNEVMPGADEIASEIVELAQHPCCGLITARYPAECFAAAHPVPYPLDPEFRRQLSYLFSKAFRLVQW